MTEKDSNKDNAIFEMTLEQYETLKKEIDAEKKALQRYEKAKARVKKIQAAAKEKADKANTHRKIVIGGMVEAALKKHYKNLNAGEDVVIVNLAEFDNWINSQAAGGFIKGGGIVEKSDIDGFIKNYKNGDAPEADTAGEQEETKAPDTASTEVV